MAITDIMIPAFATDLIAKVQCDECSETGKWWIKAAGARLDSENQACFFVTLWCSECEHKHEINFSSRPFFREEWWYDIAAWVSDAARPNRVHTVLKNMPVIPDLTVLCRQGRRVLRLRIYGAYSGEIGPVVLLYFREASSHPNSAYGAVRLEPQNRLYFLPRGDAEALGVSRWLWFRDLPHEATFAHKGFVWQKLSDDRIREIVQDRAFEAWQAGDRKGKVRRGRRR